MRPLRGVARPSSALIAGLWRSIAPAIKQPLGPPRRVSAMICLMATSGFGVASLLMFETEGAPVGAENPIHVV